MADDQAAASVEAGEASSDENSNLLQQGGQAQEATPGDATQEAGGNAEGQEQQKAPDYSDFEVPEGVSLDQELLDQAVPVFKELGLNQDQAQKLVEFETARVQRQVDQYQKQVSGWQEAVRSDAEIGGDHLEESIGLANKALNTYFGADLLDTLGQEAPSALSAIANHPAVIRGLVKLARTHLKEDQPGGGKPSQPEKSRAEKLYGTN